MKSVSVIDTVLKTPALQSELLQDAYTFFTETRSGHLGRWEYGPSLFPGDPAGGGEQWARLVSKPGRYYLTEADIDTIQWSIHQGDLGVLLSDVKTVIELGPGSSDAIARKTIPFLDACRSLKKYVAIDATLEQAADAARLVKQQRNVAVGISDQDYTSGSFERFSRGKNAVVMWGGSLGNIEGVLGEDPHTKLVNIFENFVKGLRPDDILAICFDTEADEQRILAAYGEPDLRSSILSTLFRLKRDGYVGGDFNPRLWSHQPVWVSDVGQCAHTLYPIVDQTIVINNLKVDIPAWHQLVANNSYKFAPEVVKRAAKQAGFDTAFCLQKGPIAVLVCTGR